VVDSEEQSRGQHILPATPLSTRVRKSRPLKIAITVVSIKVTSSVALIEIMAGFTRWRRGKLFRPGIV